MSLHKLQPVDVTWVISLGREAADEYLRFNHPEVTDDERLRIIEQARERPPHSTKPKPDRNRFIAAAWLCGASYRQLGHLFGITPQTILRAIDKQLGMIDRASIRLAQPPIELQRISAWWKFCQLLGDRGVLEQYDVRTLARVLHTMPETTDTEQNAYATEVGPSERLVKAEEPQTPASPEPTFSGKHFDWDRLNEEQK